MTKFEKLISKSEELMSAYRRAQHAGISDMFYDYSIALYSRALAMTIEEATADA